MAVLTKTTLASAITAADFNQPIKVTSVSAGTGSQGFVKGSVIRIDNEFFKQTADAVGVMVPVRGGDQGSYCQTHAAGAAVFAGSGADFESAAPGTAVPIPPAPAWNHVTYNAAGAIAIPTTFQHLNVDLISGAASAMTLASPTSAQEGQEMVIMAKDAQAYTVTCTAGFNGGTTTTDVATFGGAIGDNFHIKAVNLIWNVLYLRNVTLG